MISRFILQFLLTFSMVLWFAVPTSAQDPHFTQYNISPQTLNPALTGAFRGTLKAGFLYRNQWRSIDVNNLRTVTGFASRKFAVGSDYMAIGLMGTNDESGPGRYQYTQAALSGAYHMKMGAHTLRGGIQAGLINNALNDVTYPAQYDNDIGGFDPDLPNQEGQIATNTAYFDLNAGLAWQFQLANWQFTLGQALYHGNQPDASLVRGFEWRLDPRYVSHVRAQVPLTDNVAIRPSGLFKQQGKATEFMLGGMVAFGKAAPAIGLELGSYYRNNLSGYESRDLTENVDALSLNGGITFRQFRLGLAYDFNISDLQQATDYRGAFEVALTYTYGFQEQPEEQTVPCYRY